MKVMLDTNIIISAVLFPNGRTALAFLKALLAAFRLVANVIVARRKKMCI